MALKFEFLREDILARVLAVANTPNYLLRHYRGDTGVDRFAKAASTHELFAFVSDVATKEEKSFEESVRAYAALVGLAYKPIAEIKQWLAHHDLPQFHWARELVEDIQAAYVSIIATEVGWKRSENLVTQVNPASANTTVEIATVDASRQIATARPAATAANADKQVIQVLHD